MSNKLAEEQSPYLKQHANNPVDWYAWGDEAFQKARQEDKPVFLSIGYATCHWCHVMAHESFEDPEIASLLNEAFINIKVDREERPDIDSMYMTVCQMITGHGGWPLNIVMTPDKEPFFASTYIPKDTRQNRIGMKQLIPGIKGMWNNEREKIHKAYDKIKEGFHRSQQFKSGRFPGTEATDYAAEQLAKSYDEKHGGFGQAPKFPSPHNIMFLLRQWKSRGEDRFLDMAVHTLEAMRTGGLWDHIGFGFHRYSTDEKWLLPHFEKMLYDQALLMIAYTEAWQATGKDLFRQTVYETADFISKKLSSPEGGFFSAIDADSEGEEGLFYLWSTEEIEELLDSGEASRFIDTFNLEAEGNFKEEASGKKTGKNIPHLNKPLSTDTSEWFSNIREVLYGEREKREHPLLDDKILTDWTGLMIAAMAKAGFAFGEERFIERAESAVRFIEKHLSSKEGLKHRYRNGEAAIPAMADDYSFYIWGLSELYEATANPDYLEMALNYNQRFLNEFWDEENGGFYLSINDDDQVFGRQKQIYDGALPSSNSAAMYNLLRLSKLSGDTALENYADQTGKAFSADLTRVGASITFSMLSVLYVHNEPTEITLSGENQELLEVVESIRGRFSPFKVMHLITDENREQLSKIAGYTGNQSSINSKPTLYKCMNFKCDKPVTGLKSIKKSLEL